MSDKIFDLEQQIMGCWNMVDDVDMLYTYFGDDPKFVDLSAEAEDEMLNLMLGLKSLYGLKFERLFKTFEDVCREYHKRGNELEKTKSEYANLQARFKLATQEREPFDDDRMDVIGQNGNDGLHYEAPKGSMLFKDADDVLVREWQEMQDSFNYMEHEVQERIDKSKRRSWPNDFPNKHEK